jgi:hypothetical protein
MMEGDSSGSEEFETLKRLLEKSMDSISERPDRRKACLELYTRIMALSENKIAEEAAIKHGDRYSVLHLAASTLYLPLDAINRLCDVIGIDPIDSKGYTAIITAANCGNYDVV